MNKRHIAIQGAEASFHHQAANEYFSEEIDILECRSFVQVCEALQQGRVDNAVMAIENTFTGSLLPNYGLLQNYPLHIVGEYYLHIEQHLMALPGQSINEIEHVHSHPIALNQCSWFLEQHPHLIAIEKYDTAGSALEIAQQGLKKVAAIAGKEAARRYGLEILARDIENLKQNQTRFLVLSADGKESIPEPDKASICLETSHNVGSLLEVLQVCRHHNINITKIQSVPILGKPYQYQFHLDIEWNPEIELQDALRELETVTLSLRLLGTYKKGNKKNGYTSSKEATASGRILFL